MRGFQMTTAQQKRVNVVRVRFGPGEGGPEVCGQSWGRRVPDHLPHAPSIQKNGRGEFLFRKGGNCCGAGWTAPGKARIRVFFYADYIYIVELHPTRGKG